MSESTGPDAARDTTSHGTSDASQPRDVVVLGAGVAGLACAAVLSSAGRTVHVIEARDRVGGRVLTLRPPGAPLPVELGPEFVHGRPPELLALLAEAGATPVPVEQARWRATPEGLRPEPWADDALDDVLDGLDARRDPDRSFAEYLAAWARANPTRDRAARQAREFVEGFHAADATRIGERALAHETEAATAEGEDEVDFRIPDGYDRVPAHLHARLDDRVALHLGASATHVRWSRGRVEVQTRRGAAPGPTLHARALVVTLPVGVLQAAAGEPGAVAFDPPLDERKRRALSLLTTGAARRVVLHFAERFWEDEALRAPGVDASAADIGFLRTPGAPVPIWWTSNPVREPVLTGWIGGPRAERLAGHSERNVRELALDTLASALHVPRSRVEGPLRATYTYDWSRDPFARGAYSYALVGGAEARAQLAEPSDDTVFWAGEATHAAGAAATVHGALASGYRAAGEVLGR